MKQDEISLFFSYVMHNQIMLENEVRQRQANIRFRDIDIADCVELICAIQRLETFKEVTGHIRVLLKLTK